MSAMPTAPITYNGFLHCIGSIYCSEGLKGFYRVIIILEVYVCMYVCICTSYIIYASVDLTTIVCICTVCMYVQYVCTVCMCVTKILTST